MGGCGEACKNLLHGVKILSYYLTAILAFLLAWHLASVFYNKLYIPSPLAVVNRIYLEVSQESLARDVVITINRVFAAIAIAALAGLATGVIAGRTSIGARTLRPIIVATYPIPHVTLIPILLWFFGIEWSKVAIISLITYYPIAISTMEWALRTPKEYEDLIESMGGRARHKILYVVIPYILPGLLTGLRIAVSTAFAVVFIAEGFVLSGGLGAYIEDMWHRLDYTGVYAGVLTLSLLGLLTYSIVWVAEKAVRNRY